MSIIKFPKLFKLTKISPGLTKSLDSAASLFQASANTALSANRQRQLLKMAQNTFANSRKNFSKVAITQLSPGLFNQGMKLKIGEHAANLTSLHLKMSQAGQVKKLTSMRRSAGKSAVKGMDGMTRIMQTRSVADRIVNARAKGIRFIRRNGRIIPIRSKK